MYTGDLESTLTKVGQAIASIKGGAKKAKDEIATNVAQQVAPKVAAATVIAAVVGSGVMFLFFMAANRKKRKD